MLRTGLAVLAATLLVGCSESKFQKYNGPEVTRIVVFKDDLRMHLMHGDKVLTSYDVDLGFQLNQFRFITNGCIDNKGNRTLGCMHEWVQTSWST